MHMMWLICSTCRIEEDISYSDLEAFVKGRWIAFSCYRTKHGWTKADTDGKEWAHQPLSVPDPSTGNPLLTHPPLAHQPPAATAAGSTHNPLHPTYSAASNITSDAAYNAEAVTQPQISTDRTSQSTASSMTAPSLVYPSAISATQHIRDKSLPGMI